ncbi:MAG: CDP-alcohol phosphatidyltransferase family protein [Tagaea sp.]|nr:phosphatidylcholine/phosphatidylserine synthase [Azospirillum sp.]MCA3267735.1 phosphatidylcholine/phosphatidylserine synthase [Azospirillum sp.]MCZ8124199.1 phosphatidylcholine/phosphatidylserine synthase [Magnetospirillum sp.]
MDNEDVTEKIVAARQKGAAWAVHALTASGAVIGLLALIAVIEGDAREAFLWLGLALIVDGIDGPFARKFDVAERLPRFDGALLDLVVDYLTYVVVPAVLLWQFNYFGDGWIASAAAGWILFSSLYIFANLDLKTEDNYFVGFPAIWNVVALYFYILGTPVWFNLLATAILGAFSFTKVKSIHPLRVRDWRAVTLAASAAWVGTATWLLWFAPATNHAVLAVWLAASAWLVGLSFWRSFKRG